MPTKFTRIELNQIPRNIFSNQLRNCAASFAAAGLFGAIGFSIWGVLLHKLIGVGETIARPTLIAAAIGGAFGVFGIGANVWWLLAALLRDRIGGVAELLECEVKSVIPVEPGGNQHYRGLLLDAGDLSIVLSGGWWIHGHADHAGVQWEGDGASTFPSSQVEILRLPHSGVVAQVRTNGPRIAFPSKIEYILRDRQVAIVQSRVHAVRPNALIELLHRRS